MKTHNKITKLITKTMAVAALAAAGLLCGAGWVQPVAAQSGDGSVRFVSYASVGIVPGESVRVSVANTAESAGTLSLSFQYYMAHGSNSSSSVPFYESELIKVPPGEFRYSGVSRAELNTEGEPGTGRAQMMVKVTMIAPAGSKPEHFPGSLEVIPDEVQDRGNLDFKNGAEYRIRVVYQPTADDSSSMPSEPNAPISFLPGQRLSYSFFNPNEEGSQPVRVRGYIYDSYGNLLTQTDPVELRPGQSHTVNVNRDDLPLVGEGKTGRLQVRAVIQVAFMDGSVRPFKLPVWMELVENRTGSTSTGTYFTGSVTVSGDGVGGD